MLSGTTHSNNLRLLRVDVINTPNTSHVYAYRNKLIEISIGCDDNRCSSMLPEQNKQNLANCK